MQRFYDTMYIKKGKVPFDTITLTVLNGVEWKKFNLREKSSVNTDKDLEVGMGDGTKSVEGEKADLIAELSYTPEVYESLRTFINKSCTVILIDTDYPDTNGDYQSCPTVFGVRPYPSKKAESGSSPYIELSGARSSGNLTVIQRDITVTN